MTTPLGPMSLVTGAASGIGRRLVAALVSRGHRVVATDLRESALADAARQDHWPSGVVLRTLDVRDAGQWETVVAEAVTLGPGLDVLWNVAGYLKPGRVQVLAAEDVDLHFDVNVKGVIHGTRIAARYMVQQGRGHIINIASIAALAPVPGLSLYSASKYAVRGFSLAAAVDLAPYGVAVSTVCPDAVETPMLDLQRGDDDAALTFSGTRPLTVDEVVADLTGPVLEERPLQWSIPRSRAVLARLADTFPATSRFIDPLLRRIGRANQGRH